MTPEEKIQALREWANRPVTDGAQLASLNWYREAQREVRDIIDPQPPQECCTDGTCEECAPLFAWAEYRKDYEPNATVEASKAFRAGWDAARKVKHIDPPKPKWREAVDKCVKAFPPNPLGDVLMHLSALLAPKADDDTLTWHLANIVAIAEAQVGDGWQADPDEWLGGVDELDVESLIDALAEVADDRWFALSDRAAAWLQHLTEGGDA